jgi:hypothetical protein
MLTYTVIITEDETTLLMQMLNQRFVAIQRQQISDGKEPSTPFEAQLSKKLADARNQGIMAARAAGTLT